MSAAVRSANPSRDHYHESVINEKVEVPILEVLSPISTCSSQWSLSSSGSTAPTSPTTDTPDVALKWRNADLMYLLSCLLPDLLITNRLIFSPPLEDLHTYPYPYPVYLQLFKKIPIVQPPPEAYSKHAPIGTGRPCSRILLTESDTKCKSAADARRSLARNLLSNARAVGDAIDKYNVLSTLHSIPTEMLASVKRAMLCMAKTSDREWSGRLLQLRGYVDDGNHVDGVDESCEVEARLEVFLLEVGREELQEWAQSAGVALGLEERDRRVWAEVYGDAASFLIRAVRECWE